MPRSIRLVGSFILDLLVAILGTAVMEDPFIRMFRSHSALAVVARECAFGDVLAAFLGYLMARYRFSKTARWIFVPPSLFFLFGLLLFIASSRRESILVAGGAPILLRVWNHFFGVDCWNNLQLLHARNFGDLFESRAILYQACGAFLWYTVPLVRGIGFSAGAALATKALCPRRRVIANPLV